jgi:tetratricopeptide (TPR) repeat protein
MRLRLRSRSLGLHMLLGVATLALAPAAYADDDAPALVLFKEARALVNDGKYAEACPKFEASLALEVGVGTQFNLADCWEHIGRTASAQKLFLGAAASAKASGQADREQVLRDRAAALEPRISKLVIDVSDTSPHLSVKRDDLPLDEEQWGKAIAVDAGKYELSAKAPGKKPWHKSVEVKAGRSVVTVEVPALEAAEEQASAAVPKKPTPAGQSTPKAPAPASPSNDRSRVGPNYRALTLGGVGVAALAAGTILGIRYKANNDDAKAICRSNVNCTSAEIDKHDRLVENARTDRSWMYVGVGVGALSLAGAAALYLFDKPQSTKSANWHALPAVGRTEIGASVVGAF